mmetsp:Transcript_33227/g.40780  ORF Transcript_33227/g.40780 Transcript_33227/m.40780 type:complete len:136 (-) Transcript_33227:304-711(-)
MEWGFEEQLRALDKVAAVKVQRSLSNLEKELYNNKEDESLTTERERFEDSGNQGYPEISKFCRDGQIHTVAMPANVSEWKDNFLYLRIEGRAIEIPKQPRDQHEHLHNNENVEEIIEQHESQQSMSIMHIYCFSF